MVLNMTHGSPVVAALLVKGRGVVLSVGDLRAGNELTHNIIHAVLRHLQLMHTIIIITACSTTTPSLMTWPAFSCSHPVGSAVLS